MEKIMNKVMLVDEVDRELINAIVPSKLYYGLKWKYLERKLRLPVFIGLICWLAYVALQVNALAYEVVRPVISL